MPDLTLHTPLHTMPGVGPARAQALARLGLQTVADLLSWFPRDYEDRTVRPNIAGLPWEEPVCFEAIVAEPFQTSILSRGIKLTKGRVVDHTGQVELAFFGQTYVRKALVPGASYRFYGKITGWGGHRQMTNPLFESEKQHEVTGGIVPVYGKSAGLSDRLMLRLQRLAARTLSQIQEILPETLRNAYRLEGAEAAYRDIHFPATWAALAQAQRRLRFEELFCLNVGLALLRHRRETGQAEPFLHQDLKAWTDRLPFSLTHAQQRAIEEAAADLKRPIPMNRLLQGDVGSGKTVVAAACAVLAWQNGGQTALMAPTELLARQHFRTLQTLLEGLDLHLGLLTGSLPAAQKRACYEGLDQGTIDLVIGTTALISQPVVLQRLTLVITDEQHRFGVNQRAALSGKRSDLWPHVLVMSATPIPRTLALMIYGDLDLSILDELPPGRTPVATDLIGEDKRQRMYGFVRKQVGLGRQVYIVCPAVSEEETGGEDLKAVETYGAWLQNTVFPDLSVATVHGKQKDKHQVMEAFAAGTVDVLVATTVVEVGVDVPNASLMIVENADRFGLSQLHQLRGRVGRGTHLSYCVLMSDHPSQVSRQRLKTLTKTTDGFLLAEEDLKFRGPGDFFGARQHGLPQLRLASLEGDMKLLHEAQEAARGLMAQDPTLSQPEHSGLRRRAERLFQENRDTLN